jgi:hypothetical protein
MRDNVRSAPRIRRTLLMRIVVPHAQFYAEEFDQCAFTNNREMNVGPAGAQFLLTQQEEMS